MHEGWPHCGNLNKRDPPYAQRRKYRPGPRAMTTCGSSRMARCCNQTVGSGLSELRGEAPCGSCRALPGGLFGSCCRAALPRPAAEPTQTGASRGAPRPATEEPRHTVANTRHHPSSRFCTKVTCVRDTSPRSAVQRRLAELPTLVPKNTIVFPEE